MQITDIRLTKRSGEDRQLAYGSITFDDDFVVSGIRVMKLNEGNLYVGYPSRKNKNGEYKDICFPLSKSLREDICTQVIAKYEEIANQDSVRAKYDEWETL